MERLPRSSPDEHFVHFLDGWARLMECEDYDGAFSYTEQAKDRGWTPQLLREVIKAYGDGLSTQRVTVGGQPTDISQRKHVTRYPDTSSGYVGYIWYDLNIDGVVSDLTATFDIRNDAEGLAIVLDDIHVM